MKTKSLIPLLLVLSLSFPLSMAYAKSAALPADLSRALEKLSALKGFSCTFEQEIVYAEGGGRNYQGDLAVLRPGNFRWHYIKPYEQLYVSDGHGVWFYEPDLMQVQKLKDLGEVDPIVLQLLDGRADMGSISVLDKALQDDGYNVWHVSMGEGSQKVEVWLGVQREELRWIESRDLMNNRNRLSLIGLSSTLPEKKIFKFVAPEGVEVIGAME